MKPMKALIIFSALWISCLANAGLPYTYHDLALKDLDKMTALVREKIKESRASKSGKLFPLKEALQIVYGRPEDDIMIDKLTSPLRNEIEEHTDWGKALDELATDSIKALKQAKNYQPAYQATYILILHNILSDVKPQIRDNGWEKKLIEKIRDANVEVSKAARDERYKRTGKQISSPSDTAAELLKEAEKAAPAAPVEETPAAEEGSH